MPPKLRFASALFVLAACNPGGVDVSGDDFVARPVTCPPPDLFEAALCLCDDFADVGELHVGDGPSGVGHVGVNGKASFVNAAQISGNLIAFGGFHAVSAVDLGLDLATAGDASWVGLLSIGGDFSVGGDASGVGQLDLGGTLRVAGRDSLIGSGAVDRGDYEAVEAPCACDPATFFDVEAAVAAARDDNDNAAAGLPTELASVGVSELRLETGVYYFDDARSVGAVHLTIAGDVSLFIGGTIASVGSDEITIEPGATLDLFVDGTVATVGQVVAGSSGDPAAFRLYIGGDDAVMVNVGRQELYGSIYAPRAQIAYVGDTSVVGSVFADSLAGVGRLDIRYGAPGDLDPSSCEPPDDGDDDGGDDDVDDGDDDAGDGDDDGGEDDADGGVGIE